MKFMTFFLRFLPPELAHVVALNSLNILHKVGLISLLFSTKPDTSHFTYKNLILFRGKSGEKILEETFKTWDFDFEKKKSITSKDSFLININNIKKKFKN